MRTLKISFCKRLKNVWKVIFFNEIPLNVLILGFFKG